MVDIHSHVLPSLDDGASTLFEALELLRLASKNGTKKMVLTPHLYNPRIGYVDTNQIESSFRRFQEQARDLDIELFLGSEVFCSPLFLDSIEQNGFFTIHNTPYILVEFYFHDDGQRVLDAIDSLCSAGYRPIVAHPERYRFLRSAPFLVEQLLSRGALLQINKTSLSEKIGPDCYGFAMWLLSKGYVSFVASDAHDLQYRTANMQSAFMKVYSEVSKSYAEELFFHNPEAVLTGGKILTRW